jgi:hypothetical protein
MKIKLVRGINKRRLSFLLLILVAEVITVIILVIYSINQLMGALGGIFGPVLNADAPQLMGVAVQTTQINQEIYVPMCVTETIKYISLSLRLPNNQLITTWQYRQPSKLAVYNSASIGGKLVVLVIQAPLPPEIPNAIELIQIEEDDDIYLSLSAREANIPRSQDKVLTDSGVLYVNMYESWPTSKPCT